MPFDDKDQRCATVVTRGQSCESTDEKEAERTSPPVQDAELENSTGRQGGAVTDPPVDSGRAAGPALGDMPTTTRYLMVVLAGR